MNNQHKAPKNMPAFDEWYEEQERQKRDWTGTSPLQEWLIYVDNQLSNGASPELFFGLSSVDAVKNEKQ